MAHLRSMLRVLVSTAAALLMAQAAWTAPTRPPEPAPAPVRLETREVPREARATLAYVRAHGTAPVGQVGGRRFGNYGRNGEQKLPQFDARGKRIEYREWDIHPRIPGRSRGAERLVTGSDGRAWYTSDHYTSFTEIE